MLFAADATRLSGDASPLGSLDVILIVLVLVAVVFGLRLLVQAVRHDHARRQRS